MPQQSTAISTRPVAYILNGFEDECKKVCEALKGLGTVYDAATAREDIGRCRLAAELSESVRLMLGDIRLTSARLDRLPGEILDAANRVDKASFATVVEEMVAKLRYNKGVVTDRSFETGRTRSRSTGIV